MPTAPEIELPDELSGPNYSQKLLGGNMMFKTKMLCIEIRAMQITPERCIIFFDMVLNDHFKLMGEFPIVSGLDKCWLTPSVLTLHYFGFKKNL